MQKVLSDRVCVGMMDVKEPAKRINQKWKILMTNFKDVMNIALK